MIAVSSLTAVKAEQYEVDSDVSLKKCARIVKEHGALFAEFETKGYIDNLRSHPIVERYYYYKGNEKVLWVKLFGIHPQKPTASISCKFLKIKK